MIWLSTYPILERAEKIEIRKMLLKARGKSQMSQNLQGALEATTKSLEVCWLFMTSTSMSCQQSVWWKPGVTFGKASIRKEGRANALSNTPASNDNLQNIMTVSLLPSRTHTAFQWAKSNLKLHGEGETEKRSSQRDQVDNNLAYRYFYLTIFFLEIWTLFR